MVYFYGDSIACYIFVYFFYGFFFDGFRLVWISVGSNFKIDRRFGFLVFGSYSRFVYEIRGGWFSLSGEVLVVETKGSEVGRLAWRLE